jgi:hypothetical protein
VEFIDKTKMITMKETRNGVTEVSEITQEQYDFITSDETLKLFRRLGGSETVTWDETKRGYDIVKLISTSPDKDVRVVREFSFK